MSVTVRITKKAIGDVRGGMLRDIVPSETQCALGDDRGVFKHAVEGDAKMGVRGREFGMVIRSDSEGSVLLLEVKHSAERMAD